MSFYFFYRISSSHIFNSVCWSHALVNGPTSKRPASDGGRCSGQLLMMWSAVCSGSPHSHAALSASPHFFMEALYRPTPVRSHCVLSLCDFVSCRDGGCGEVVLFVQLDVFIELLCHIMWPTLCVCKQSLPFAAYLVECKISI